MQRSLPVDRFMAYRYYVLLLCSYKCEFLMHSMTKHCTTERWISKGISLSDNESVVLKYCELNESRDETSNSV
jgi:hypothetical protein